MSILVILTKIIPLLHVAKGRIDFSLSKAKNVLFSEPSALVAGGSATCGLFSKIYPLRSTRPWLVFGLKAASDALRDICKSSYAPSSRRFLIRMNSSKLESPRQKRNLCENGIDGGM